MEDKYEVNVRFIVNADDESEAEEFVNLLCSKGILALIDQEDLEPIDVYSITETTRAEVDFSHYE